MFKDVLLGEMRIGYDSTASSLLVNIRIVEMLDMGHMEY